MHNFACYHGFLLFFCISLKVLNTNAVCFSPYNIALSNVTNPRFTLTPSSGANGELYEPNMTCYWKIVVPSSYETKIIANISNKAVYSNDILRIDDCNGGNVINLTTGVGFVLNFTEHEWPIFRVGSSICVNFTSSQDPYDQQKFWFIDFAIVKSSTQCSYPNNISLNSNSPDFHLTPMNSSINYYANMTCSWKFNIDYNNALQVTKILPSISNLTMSSSVNLTIDNCNGGNVIDLTNNVYPNNFLQPLPPFFLTDKTFCVNFISGNVKADPFSIWSIYFVLIESPSQEVVLMNETIKTPEIGPKNYSSVTIKADHGTLQLFYYHQLTFLVINNTVITNSTVYIYDSDQLSNLIYWNDGSFLSPIRTFNSTTGYFTILYLGYNSLDNTNIVLARILEDATINCIDNNLIVANYYISTKFSSLNSGNCTVYIYKPSDETAYNLSITGLKVINGGPFYLNYVDVKGQVNGNTWDLFEFSQPDALLSSVSGFTLPPGLYSIILPRGLELSLNSTTDSGNEYFFDDEALGVMINYHDWTISCYKYCKYPKEFNIEIISATFQINEWLNLTFEDKTYTYTSDINKNSITITQNSTYMKLSASPNVVSIIRYEARTIFAEPTFSPTVPKSANAIKTTFLFIIFLVVYYLIK